MKQMLIPRVKVLRGLWENVKGLIGEDKPRRLLLKTRFGIHTFGVKFPIDVVILDKNYYVRKIKKSLGSNRICFWNPAYPIVLELPVGDVKRLGLCLGNKVVIAN